MNTFKFAQNFVKIIAIVFLLTPLACGDDATDDLENNVTSNSNTGNTDGGNVGNSNTGNTDGGNVGNSNTGNSDAGNDNMTVSLGGAGDFVILAKSGISNVPTSAITGDLGVSPIDSTGVTGFSTTQDPTTQFATSPQVTGRIYASDYSAPTPANLTTAVSAMETAFTSAAGRPSDVTELGAGDIGGMTLEPGVYAWGTGLLIPDDITLDGSDTDVWIFQIAQDLTLSSGSRVVLSGGALAENIFWQVGGQVTMETTSHLEGVVLSQTAIVLRTGATVNGRLFAQTAVELDANTVVEPAN